ncbi:hypothetical protein C8Q76DRAFT_108650 [Earliella scabrosa]|nr:hypothetical protein C8Q76DRAFT_108650 [Earliella scabrosa]
MSQSVVAGILIIRTYALYNRSRRVLVGLLGLSATLFVITLFVVGYSIIYSAHTSVADDVQIGKAIRGCYLGLTTSQGSRTSLAWFMMTCLDTTIFALTLVKVVELGHFKRQGLLRVFLRDGAMYYGILVIASVVTIITLMAPRFVDPERGISATLANCLSITLMSRVVINIRDPKLRGGIRRLGYGRWTLSGLPAAQPHRAGTVARLQTPIPSDLISISRLPGLHVAHGTNATRSPRAYHATSPVA